MSMDRTVFGTYHPLMRILFLAAETAPFVTVGGLSQVTKFLSRALIGHGYDVRVFTPFYGSIDREELESHWKLSGQGKILQVPASTVGVPRSVSKEGEDEMESVECGVVSYVGGDDDPQVTFLQNREYYELRANVFGYADDHVRFALMSKGCLEWLLTIDEARRNGDKEVWWPDVIHCHDWHAGYFVDLARRDPRYCQVLKDVAIVFTVHNFRYQGNGEMRYLPSDERDDGLEQIAAFDDPRLLKQNPLRRGLLYSDAVTTVSPTHALEVLTEEYAEGLLDTLVQVRGRLSGILNGLDTEKFNPGRDPYVKRHYSRRRFVSARGANKMDLQRQFSLPMDREVPLLGYVGRLDQQKGLDLLVESVGRLMEERDDVQLVVVGGGDDRYRRELDDLRSRFSDRVGLHLLPDFHIMPRKIFAGADLILIPSHFEPGGIVALEALRYGAVPLVRRTGGLNDSVEDFDPDTRQGNGFSFRGLDAWSMFAALVEALTVYRQPSLWHRLVENAMSCDFSWDYAAIEYGDWYARVLSSRKPPLKLNILSRIKKTL